jgi:hypothetical protein
MIRLKVNGVARSFDGDPRDAASLVLARRVGAQDGVLRVRHENSHVMRALGRWLEQDWAQDPEPREQGCHRGLKARAPLRYSFTFPTSVKIASSGRSNSAAPLLTGTVSTFRQSICGVVS